MTFDALQATSAMLLGTLLYQQRLGQMGQAAYAKDGSAVNYNQLKMQFQTNTSPMIMALPYMTAEQNRCW